MNVNQRSFIDSNIWLYAFVEADNIAKTKQARDLIRSVDPVISTQVINEVCINLIRKAGFTEEQIRLLVISFFAKYTIVQLDRAILLLASRLRNRYSLSFWDSIIVASAIHASAAQLYSEDMQDGLLVAQQLRIINPFKRE